MLKVIEEFPDYLINENGDVFSKKSNKWLSTRIYEGGYWGVNLRSDTGKNVYRSCHTLVAKAFLLDSYQEGMVVNHKDLDKSNCHVSNLEWVTHKENSQHYVENKPEHASAHRRKISVDKLHQIGELLEVDYMSTEEISKITGVDRNRISKMRTGALYSWVSEKYNIKPEPLVGLDEETALEICKMLEAGIGCKAICDKFKDNTFVKKSSVNNIKYRKTFEHLSEDFTWWVGKYKSKSESRGKVRPSTTSKS